MDRRILDNQVLGKEWTRYLELREERPELFVDNGSIHIIFDEDKVKYFQHMTGRKIGVVYESRYTIKVVDLVCETEENYFPYERSIPAVKNPAVVTVPVMGDKFVLLKQYRHCIRDYEYSFPRGFGEKGLSGEENAKKELGEEIGAVVNAVHFLGDMTPDSGGQSTVVSMYVCELDSYDAGKREEGIEEILEVTQEEISEMIQKNQIKDGFTLSALTLYERKYKGV